MDTVQQPGTSSSYRRHRGRFALCATLLGALALSSAARAQSPGELKQRGYVNDFGNFLNAEESSQIGAICQALEARSGDHLLVVTVATSGNLTPGQFGEQLRTTWFASADDRERAMIIVLNGLGKVGVGIGSTLEERLTQDQFTAALQESLAVPGDQYGPKLILLVQRVAELLGSAADRAKAVRSGGVTLGGLIILLLASVAIVLSSANPIRKVSGVFVFTVLGTIVLTTGNNSAELLSMPTWMLVAGVGIALVVTIGMALARNR